MADAPTGPTDNGQWVLGYYAGYDVDAAPIATIQWSGLTHVALAPLLVKADQTLDDSFDGLGRNGAIELANAAHAHNVKALLMLGGAGAGPNIAVAAQPANRPAFVVKLRAALDDLGYDGIDLDWEDSVNLDDLVGLARDLRAARADIVLSYPAGSINGNYQTVDPRFAELARSLDRFMVQTYYPSTAVAGSGWDSWFVAPLSGVTPTTPIAADDTLNRYAAVGIPKAKLGLGIGAYAICYTGGITAPHQPTSSTTQIGGGDNAYPLRTFFAADGTFATAPMSARKYDMTSSQPYLSLAAPVDDPHCGAATQYISYENESSIIAKGMFSKTQGYGGVIIWTINEMTPATMQALHDGFLTP
jgi:chitinase